MFDFNIINKTELFAKEIMDNYDESDCQILFRN